MSRTISSILIFALGAISGASIAWKYAKIKYETISKEEINSVKEVFERRSEEVEKKNEEAFVTKEKPDLFAYNAKIDENKYSSNNDKSDDLEETSIYYSDDPIVISPDDFGENDEYECFTVTCYADDVVADEDDKFVNVEETIGRDAVNHFGEYEDDSVCIRNDRLKAYYEILRDTRRFEDVVRKHQRPPHDIDSED